MFRLRLLLAAACLAHIAAHADIPASYAPLVPQPAFSFTQRLFDLTPAFTQARAQDGGHGALIVLLRPSKSTTT